MRCYICNKILEDDHVQYNQDHKDFDPCPTCLNVIEDLIAGYGDRPAIETDDFDPILEGLFPTTYDPFGTEDGL